MAFADDWKNCKKEFEKLTGKKKPAEKTLGSFRKSTGLASSLKKIDSALNGLSAKNARGTLEQKDLTAYDKLVANYKKEMESYIGLLERTLKQESDADSAYGKAIVMLKKRLKAIFGTADMRGSSYAMALDKSLKTNDKVMRMIIPGMRSSLKKMSAFVAKVNAQKSTEDQVQTFNDGIVKATRDITQNLTNAIKFQKKGMVEWEGRDMSGASKVLTAWSNDGRKLSTDADATLVRRELTALAQVVKVCKDWTAANAA